MNNTAQPLPAGSVQSGGERAKLIMQIKVGKSDRCRKGEAREAVRLEAEHFIQFGDHGKIPFLLRGHLSRAPADVELERRAPARPRWEGM